jgi:hypothetical protein
VATAPQAGGAVVGGPADQGGVVEAEVDSGADVDAGTDVDVDADVEGDVVTGGVAGVVSGDVDVIVVVPPGDVVDSADATIWSSSPDVSSPARRHTLPASSGRRVPPDPPGTRLSFRSPGRLRRRGEPGR